MPPPIPPKKTPKPAWALDLGAKLKEDDGGKYYEMEHVVVTKVYVYPIFKVEMPNGKSYVKKPYGYKNKTNSRKDNEISVNEATKKKTVPEVPVNKKVRTEEW